jgi:FkbM family methyltransferase
MVSHDNGDPLSQTASGNSTPKDGAWVPRPEAGPAVSYSQNAEDVRLWRVFGEADSGLYVDVGAGNPTEYSVTKVFYDRGWSGINVEPGPAFPELAAARSRDVNLNIAVALEEGTRDFWVSSPHSGISTFYPEAMLDALPEGFLYQKVSVDCVPLRRILEDHLNGRAIDFMSVDVEGAEAEVIRSIDFKATRPTVLVVEAIAPLTREPTHEDWEPLVLGADYAFAAFDGINRFYVELSHRELVPALAYPISVLDGFATHESQTKLRQREAEIETKLETELESRRLEAEGFRQRAEELQGELAAAYTSRIWRAGTAIAGVANPVVAATSRLRGLKRIRPTDAYKAATAPRQAWHFPRGTIPRAGSLNRLVRALGPSDSAVTISDRSHVEGELDQTNWTDETSLLKKQLSWEERQAVVEADALARSLSDRAS